MKKKIKTIILVIMLGVSITGIIFTIFYAKNTEQASNFVPMEKLSSTLLSNSYIFYIGIFSLIFSLALIYLIMEHKNSFFYKNKEKLTIYILLTIICTSVILIGSTFILYKYLNYGNKQINFKDLESNEKEEVILDESNILSTYIINLNEEDTDVTIKKAGTYTFTGTFNHAIIVDASNVNVEIVLDNVTISNSNTAAIIGLDANKITINLSDNSVNSLSDGGSSTYDGCIYSNSELIFTGSGYLSINGLQVEGEGIATEGKDITFDGGTYHITSLDDGINAGGDGGVITFNDGIFYIDASGDGIDSNKSAIINGGTIFVMGSDVGGDAGIDTNDGYTINGGTVIALGSDMIETPLNSSKQNALCFSLSNSISANSIITLMKDDKEVISFAPSKSFKTIIISSPNLLNGTYELYKNGSNTGNLVNGIYEDSNYIKGNKITINNNSYFTVSNVVNLYEEK